MLLRYLRIVATSIVTGLGLYLFICVGHVDAASYTMSTDTNSFAIGKEFSVTVRMGTDDGGINAGQATITYPTGMLQVVGIDQNNSVFNFWLVGPSYSNSDGTVTFVGGSAAGISGRSLEVMKIRFRVKGTGLATIAFTDGAITANDGSGSNILTSAVGLKLNTAVSTGVTEIEAPKQIIRTAEPSVILPESPKLEIPTYPNPDSWYNITSPFTASWKLPNDITKVATLIDQKSTTNPTQSEGLFESKQFQSLTDGTWYLHVRFGNALGWGKTIHYPIKIDTVPPSALTIESKDGVSTDNPIPTLTYHTVDSLSGVQKYVLRVDGNNVGETNKESYTLAPLVPGNRTISVIAYDAAGNGSFGHVGIEIKPIPSPQIAAISKKLYVGQGAISVVGSGQVDTTIQVTLLNKAGNTIVGTQEAVVDNKGGWSVAFDQLLKKGDYYIQAIARDNRGALSLPTTSDSFTLYNPPIVSIYGVDITETGLIALLITLFLLWLIIGCVMYKMGVAQRRRKSLIAQREVNNILTSIENETETILTIYNNTKRKPNRKKNDVKLFLEQMHDNISHIKNYIVEDIKDIER